MNKSFLLIALSLFVFSAKPSFAAPNTDFSSCGNPQGSIRSSFPNGTHGIVNNSGTYAGSDTVYSLSNGNAMQCFCGSNGEGIQTDWLKNTGFTDDEIAILKKQGWTSIPDGSLWGLEPVQYFAMNSSYACKETVGPVNQSNPSPSNNNSTNSSSNNSTGSVLGASTTVLTGLANTGNSLLFYTVLTLGIALISFGIFMPSAPKTSRHIQ